MDSLAQLLDRIEFLERKLALNTENTFKASPFEYEREAPLVTNLVNVARSAASGSTPVALTWEVPDDDRIEAFEIWSKNLSEDSPQWVLKGAVTQPPWGDNLISDIDKVVSFAVRTKLRNGLGTTIDNSPTVPVSITAPSDEITSASQIANGIIGDSKLDRTTDAIQITNADVVSLAATKITAGTLVAGVIYAGAIAASQITAGTISAAVSMTSPNITSTSGSNAITINGGQLKSLSSTRTATLNSGQLVVAVTAGGAFTRVETDIVSTADGSNYAFLSCVGSGSIDTSGVYKKGGVSGISGTFTTVDGKTATVSGGIITSLV